MGIMQSGFYQRKEEQDSGFLCETRFLLEAIQIIQRKRSEGIEVNIV